MKNYNDIKFKVGENRSLYLDLAVPEDNCPLIMWIHGGAWRGLNRTWNLATPMTSRGYAVATVDYRYSDEAPFPAQMEDLKDALAFLRENADTYGYDGKQIIVSGDSAGGHLASLMGVSVGHQGWERGGADYGVAAVVDFCGPSDFVRMTEPKKRSAEQPADGFDPESKLIGVPSLTPMGRQLSAAASPLTYVHADTPPFLILHGSEDPTVPPDQSRLLRNALEDAGVPVHLYLVPGGVHGLGGKLLYDVIQEFLDYYVKGIETVETPHLEPRHDRPDPLPCGIKRAANAR